MRKKIINSYITFKERGFKVLISALFYYLKLLFYKYILKKNTLKKKIFNNYMHLSTNDPGISKTLILFGKRELEQKYIMNLVLSKNMTVLDIGANIGYYALIELNLIGHSGYLIAVEPSPSNYSSLKKNIELNKFKNFEVHNVAISDKVVKKEFYLSRSSNLNTFHKSDDLSLDLSGEKIEVQTETIYSLINDKKIDLIRMDVEGHEVSIFKSLINYVSKTNIKPMILFEPHLSRYNKENDMAKTLKDLLSIGYEAIYVGSSWENGSRIIENKGYSHLDIIQTDGVERRIYSKINNEDLISLITKEGGLRTVLLKA
jgi:FkbM family methyltransferase